MELIILWISIIKIVNPERKCMQELLVSTSAEETKILLVENGKLV